MSCVGETYVGCRIWPLYDTVVVAVKFVPFRVSVTPLVFVCIDVGESDVSIGTGGGTGSAETLKVLTFDVPPAAVSLETVTGTLPAVATCAAVTCPVNCVAEPKVVGMATPFHRMVAEDRKLVPVTSS